MLIGEYTHTIDNKKRVAIPSKLRRAIGETGAVLTRGPLPISWGSYLLLSQIRVVLPVYSCLAQSK